MRKNICEPVCRTAIGILMCAGLITGCGSENTENSISGENAASQTSSDEADLTDTDAQAETEAIQADETSSDEADTTTDTEEDTEEKNLSSADIYEDFLAGNAEMSIDKVGFDKEGWGEYDPEMNMDEKYTLDSFLLKYFTDERDFNDENYAVEELYYAYTDCGNDGTDELILQFKSYKYNDEYNNILVVKDVDGELNMCALFSDGYRSYNYINKNGVIGEGGSGGASDWVDGYYGIDENGDKFVIYQSETCDSWCLYLGADSNPGETAENMGVGDICIRRYDFESYDEEYDETSYLNYLKNSYYTYGKDFEVPSADESIYVADSSYAEFMDTISDNWYMPEEMQKIVDERLEKFGLTEDMLGEDDLSWTKWEGHDDLFAQFPKQEQKEE